MVAFGTDRSQKDLVKLAFLQTKAVILPRHIGYWEDLAYHQGSESIFKAQQIACVQRKPEVAQEILDFVKEDV
ncbi:MAG: hypothetical protein WAO57_13270 [Syntrophomonadaceae bacterium]